MMQDKRRNAERPEVRHTHLKLRGYEAVIATVAALSGLLLALIELYRVITSG